MNIVELFAGIGSQRKAIRNLKIKHKVLNIAEWYIPAILAYDSIHNGDRDIQALGDISREELIKYLSQFTFSMDSKRPLTKNALRRLNINIMKHLYIANKRTNNLVSIDKVHGNELPNDIDVLTYSFPCQDLSNVGAFHGYRNGIDKGVKSRSGLLWEVERIMEQRVESKSKLPRILLMENVSSLLAKRHKGNFDNWIKSLESMGYLVNEHFLLNSKDCGIPQNRKRIFMVSVYTKDLRKRDIERIRHILKQEFEHEKLKELQRYLKTNYVGKYKLEADAAQPKDTPSRKTIYANNYYLHGNKRAKSDVCATITTRQDRHPNSGVLEYQTKSNNFRFLTSREVFLLMGFTEEDYDSIERNNFKRNSANMFFTRDKYYVLAGNSIVVDVLERIFVRIEKIYTLIEGGKKNEES